MKLALIAASLAVSLALEAQLESLERIDTIPSDKCAAAVVANEDDRLQVFSLSHDSALWHKYQRREGGWSSWLPMGGKQKFSSGPSVVRNADGRLEIFIRGADKTIYHSA